MKLKTLAVATALVFGSAAAVASPYQIEGSASYYHLDRDSGGSDGAFGVRGEYHFAPVQTRNHPLAEAAFLERSTNVYAQGADDFDALSFGGEPYVANTLVYVAADVSRYDYGSSDQIGRAHV